MKKKKGFTLVELLAVIVILAIIALVTIPIILNMISKARKRAAVAATYGYVDAIEYSIGLSDMKDDIGARGMLENMKLTIPNKKFDTQIPAVNLPDNTSEKPSYTVEEIDAAGVRVKGKKPTSGNVTITKRKVSHANICIGGYIVDYNGKEATAQDKCGSSTEIAEVVNYESGDIVYFDPKSDDKCDASTFDITEVSNENSTCYKWRVINADGDNLTLQLDHHIAKGLWTNEANASVGPDAALNQLKNATYDWTRVEPLDYEYDTSDVEHNYGKMTCNNGVCTWTATKTTESEPASGEASETVTNSEEITIGSQSKPVRARMITGEEIKALTVNAGAANNSAAAKWTQSKTTGFDFSKSSSAIGTKLSWLLENTYENTNSGATANAYEYDPYVNGYWTLTPYNNDSGDSAWYVSYEGEFITNDLVGSAGGIRPVIKIDKEMVSSTEKNPSPKSSYNPGDVLIYDPVTNKKCLSVDYNKVRRGESTCYKWRVITTDDTSSKTKITLQMDHNLINTSDWISKSDFDLDSAYGTYGSTRKGPITALKALENATKNWDNSLKLTYTYQNPTTRSSVDYYRTLSCTNGTCTEDGYKDFNSSNGPDRIQITTNLKARMITGEEVKAIAMAAGSSPSWTPGSGSSSWYYLSSGTHSEGNSTQINKVRWMSENTSSAGINTYGFINDGYWTLTPGGGDEYRVWKVKNTISIQTSSTTKSTYVGDNELGVRPVIEVNKSIFK